MKKLLSIIVMLVMSVTMMMAQKTVTGRVISGEDGEPIIGASVVATGTTNGTVTDFDGNFSVNVPESAKTLTVSYVGMESQTVNITGKTLLVTLSPNNEVLDEVMVVAYGTQKRSSFTGSASVVKSDDIDRVQVTNAVDALKGKASGVQINTASGQPGETPTIRIRGVNSINAGNSPLIVLDGAPFAGSLNDINPHDVESMTVLKDAASTALYGARGGNGVIMITTKSGQKGQGAKITFDAKWGSNQKAVPEYETISNPAAHYEMWYRGLKNMRLAMGDTEAAAHAFANANMINSNTYGLIYNVFNVPKGQYLIGQDGKLNPNATLGNVITGADGNQYLLTPDNWIDETYFNSLRQEYTISATGASDKGSFFLSANYLDNDGVTYASAYKRLTTRLKADYQLKKWLKMGANMSYGHFDRDSLGEDGSSGSSGNAFAFGTAAPIYPMYVRDADGNKIIHDATGMTLYDYGQGTSYVGLTRPYLSQANPVSDNRLQINNAEGNTFNGTGSMQIDLPYGFTIHSINTVNHRETRSTSTTNRYFGQYASQNGQNSVSHSRTYSYNFQQRLNWHKVYGKHDIEAMVGHEYYRSKYYYLNGYKNQTFGDDNAELNSAVVMGSTGSYRTDYNTEQWLSRAMYNYDEKYFAQASIMRQGSSTFHPDHRWGTFWSGSLGWNIHKEDWFNAEWIDELKLKASYGENGNDGIDSYLYTNYSAIVNSDDQIALKPSSLGNEEITWEKNAKFNTGIDFSLFKGRLSGGIEYYNNRTNDMLSWFSLPASYGYTGYYANVGNMINRGLEIELRGDVVRTKDLTVTAYANITTNHNEITELAEERKTMEVDGIHGYSSGSYFYGEGRSRYTYYSKRYAGVNEEGLATYYVKNYEKNEDGSIKEDSNGNKVITELTTTTNFSEADYFLNGDCLPKYYGGFGVSASWKGLDVSVDFAYQIGGKVYDGTYASLMNLNNRGYAIHVDMLDAWSPENTGSNIPRAAFNDSYMASGSDRFLIDASYLTLNNISVGYSLPKKWIKALDIANLRLYAVADNVWTWSKRQGLDPCQSITGSNTASYYKPIRTISGGITVTF